MSSSSPTSLPQRIALALPLLLAALLLFKGLGDFGLWEPHETKCADLASAFMDPDDQEPKTDPVEPGFHLGERLAAASWSAFGRSETTARIPSAVLAFLSVLVLYFSVLALTGPRIAIYASLIFASAPVLLLHGRQLTSGAPLLFGETCALSGLALVLFGNGRRTAIAGLVLTSIGLVVGWLAAGLLIGVAVPAGTILATLACNGDLQRYFSSAPRPPLRRLIAALAAIPVLLLAVGAFASIAASDIDDISLITGGLADGAAKPRSFDYGLSLLAYGWFPWTAIVPIALLSISRTDEMAKDPRARLTLFAICALAVGYLAHSAFTTLHGAAPLFLALPICLTAALALVRLEESEKPLVIAGLVAAVALTLLIRDFAQQPAAILNSMAWDGIPLPKEFMPVYPIGVASIPFAILLVMSAFFGSASPSGSIWRPWRTFALVPLAAASIGGYISFVLVPGLSVDLSSRHVLEAYEKFAEDSAPLGVLGPKPPMDAEKLRNEADLIRWLERDERVFAMFPPAKLAAIDRDYRQKTGKHLFILDAESDRYLLTTNRPRKGERDANPIAAYVSSKAFKPAPAHEKRANFEDRVTFLGWSLRSESGKPYLEQGKEFELTSYWRCDARMSKDYKVFIHFDGTGPRIHGDHMPVMGRYSTREWRPGDFIKDVYKGDVPLYQAKGSYRVRLGLYKGQTRMKILGDLAAKENAVDLGRVELK